MRKAYFVITVLLLISAVLQFYFAALGVFGPQGEDDNLFGFHRINGSMVLPAPRARGHLRGPAKAGARTVWLTALPILLIAVQYLIFIVGGLVGGGRRGQPHGRLRRHPRAARRERLAVLGTIITLVTRARARAFPKRGSVDGGTPAA